MVRVSDISDASSGKPAGDDGSQSFRNRLESANCLEVALLIKYLAYVNYFLSQLLKYFVD